MLDSVARGVYNRRATRYLLDVLELDLPARRFYSRVQEITRGTTQLTVDEVSVELSAPTVPEATYLEPELAVLERLLDRIRPDDVFWDVGADKGLYSCLVAASQCDSVVAFEPHPVRRGELERNLQRNDLSATIRSEALASVDGTAAFNYRIETSKTNATGQGEFVATLRQGDTLVGSGSVTAPTVVKIDVEGAEYEVLQGLTESLEHPECRLVVCELHDAGSRGFEGSQDQVRNYLTTRGFDVSTVATRSGEGWTQPYIEAVKP